MKRWHVLVLAAAAGVGAYWAGHALRGGDPAAPAPAGGPVAFALPDADGRMQDLRQWRGRIVLVNFWATWCPPCREEMPLLMAIQKRYASRGLQVIGVAIDDAQAVRAFRDRLGITYPLLIAETEGTELMLRYGNRHGALPYSLILDREGRIVSRKTGAYERAELEAAVEAAFSPPGDRAGAGPARSARKSRSRS